MKTDYNTKFSLGLEEASYEGGDTAPSDDCRANSGASRPGRVEAARDRDQPTATTTDRQLRINMGRSRWSGYGVAVGATAAAVASDYLLIRFSGNVAPFLPFIIAVIITAGYGGLRPGLLATALGAIAVSSLFLELDSAALAGGAKLVWPLTFLGCGGLISWLCESLQSARYQAQASALCVIEKQQRLEAEGAARRKIDARYLHLLNSNLFGVGVGNFSGNCIKANDAMLSILGFSRAELESGSLRWKDLTPADHREGDERALTEARATGVCRAYEKEIFHKDGSRVPVLVYLAVTPDDPECLVALVIDLTKQKQAENALRTSEARFRLLIEGNHDYSFFMLDPDGHVVTWNAGGERTTGYRAEEILGKHFSIFYPAEDVASGNPNSELQRAIQGQAETEGWRVRQNGSRFWANVVTTALRDENGNLLGFAKITKDMTERRRAEVLLTSMLNNVMDGIIGIDEHGTINSFNAAAQRLFGYQDFEVLGKNVKMLMPETYRGEHDSHLANYRHRNQPVLNGPLRYVTGLRKNGSTFPMELSVNEFFLYDQRHFTGVVRDITQQRTLEDQLRQAQKMEAIGQLAGGVAHDFNNMLTVIFAYTELLLDTLAEDDPMRSAAEAIGEAGNRAANLTRQLLAFGRRAVMEPKLLDVNSIVMETEKMLHRLIGEDILLTTVLGPDLDQVNIDPGQMDQVLVNLAVNARDAMPQGGQLTIETSNIELDEAYAQTHPTVKPGRYVKLAITDNGCGMTPAVKSHAFEPFFTTKAAGKGTGLGLATVYGIVKQSGGHLDVYSELCYGTTFKIYLPAAEQPASSRATDAITTDAENGTETVLVVEDEDGVRKMIVGALERQGYKVLQAANGPEAMRVGEDQNIDVDLLLTDVVMPELNGRQLAEILHLRSPDMKVLFMSGYTDDAVIRHGILHADVDFLQKPFSPITLGKKIREVLDHDRTSPRILPVTLDDATPQNSFHEC